MTPKPTLRIVAVEPPEQVPGDAVPARVLTLRAGPVCAVPAVPVSPAIAGPSESFIRRRFDPEKPHSPARFEPTTKADGDVVI
jgi:hypothetical protein